MQTLKILLFRQCLISACSLGLAVARGGASFSSPDFGFFLSGLLTHVGPGPPAFVLQARIPIPPEEGQAGKQAEGSLERQTGYDKVPKILYIYILYIFSMLLFEVYSCFLV